MGKSVYQVEGTKGPPKAWSRSQESGAGRWDGPPERGTNSRQDHKSGPGMPLEGPWFCPVS